VNIAEPAMQTEFAALARFAIELTPLTRAKRGKLRELRSIHQENKNA